MKLELSNVRVVEDFPVGWLCDRQKFDCGTGWNNRVSNPSLQTFTSLGLGLRWQPFQGLNLRADYASTV
ncbi:MAG: hypothetical protein V7K53_23015 [Nostoc sp.]|uniref:hypothetical protein n=1 Tax=Nostoc sp. TaxID=1180 RepID=UPI002FF85068